ncbi:MAG: hypothetical protein M1358_14450 [Chloroflexi bacterium]|nr:hypothetical protein [Chloroflexota bacterium]
MKNCQVFILNRQPLFAEGLEEILTGKDGVEVVGVEDRPGTALEIIRSLHPDVVIAVSGNEDRTFGATLLKISREFPQIRVISLNLDDNTMTVLDSQSLTVTKPADLLMEAIRTT